MPTDKNGGEDIRDRFTSALMEGLVRADESGRPRLLVALSGGADSTALLLGLLNMADSVPPKPELPRPRIEAAHFNHHLRPESSDTDEAFCRKLCANLGVRIHVGSGDVAAHAAANTESIEATARKLRYEYLAEIAQKKSFAGLVTGHTMDDQAETVLLALTRGSGLSGISGMSPVSARFDLSASSGPLRVLRPMLQLRRSDTEALCRSHGIEPLHDESNSDLKFARNRIRHRVLPELEKINSRVVEAIGRLAEIAESDRLALRETALEGLSEIAADRPGSIRRDKFTELMPELRPHVLIAALTHVIGYHTDLDQAAIESCLRAVRELPSGSLDLPNRVTFVLERDTLRFLRNNEDPACPFPGAIRPQYLFVPGVARFPEGSDLSARIVSPVPDPRSLTRWQAIISADLTSTQLTIRGRQPGDRFHPLGMPTEMKLQDFMVNQHIPARWRDGVPLVLADDRICWVVGERIAEWAKVPTDAKSAVLLEYSPPANPDVD